MLSDTTLSKVSHYLENSSSKENDLYVSDKINFTKAILLGTLHGEESLTKNVYKLLHQKLTYQSGILYLAESATLVATISVNSI